MRKKIISLVVIIGLATTISMPILAEPISDNITRQNTQLRSQSAQSKAQDMEVSIEKMDSNIEKIYAQVNSAKVKMDETEQQIEKSKKDIQVAEANIKEEEDLFNKRMRSMYMNGVDSYLEILLNSKGVEDLLSRVENIKKIVEYDNKITGELKAKMIFIENQKVTLETRKTVLVLLKTDNESKLKALKEKKQEQIVLIAEAKVQKQLYSSALNDGQTIVNNSIKIQQIKSTATKFTPSRGAASTSSSGVVAYASNFLGTPYAWGGNGPSTFDCSGFVKYVYAHFGVSLSRTTGTQINEGSYVPKANLKAGDLIFFGETSNPHHVGIYVGNNSYIHAPSTGDVVKISALTRRDYLTARRVR